MGSPRFMAFLFLGLAYLLRAESSLRASGGGKADSGHHPEHVQQHQHTENDGLRLIDGLLHSEKDSGSIGSMSGGGASGKLPVTKFATVSGGSGSGSGVGTITAATTTTLLSSATHFADEGSENVTALVGHPAVLLCSVRNLGNRTVSWIRKRDLHILTSMALTYTSDGRFTVIGNTETSDDWNLRIDYVQTRDEGIYECQVNTEPKIHRAVYLRVLDVQAEILGPDEVYVRKGSTISLTCMVNSQGVPPSNVTWYHAGNVIDFDGPRGGVSLETEKSKGGTTSKLLITRASLGDSGNYSCVSSKAARATVVVHVLNGEHPAAMQHGDAARTTGRLLLLLQLLLLVCLRPFR
ncbi:zwei Ig domain protein zig-8-like [Trichogramma pretiosum]|uniref:zwei Ig domain protein zig-8-like n=1 Tax=Trichogramma pretiosum TaxID=7493 RepID=UPI0006C94A32|nr:zwei Ig domain protein zig-8-like [Trichogramma pretiosum]